MRVPVAEIAQIIVFTAELLLGPPCDVRKGLQELMSKPKTFIELSLGLEDRLEASHLKVLKDVKIAQLDLEAIRKKSNSAYGLALWLTALADYSHHTGLMRKAKYIPSAKKREQKQQWQYTSNAEQLNDEVLMRMPKWSRVNKPETEEDIRQQMRRIRQSNTLETEDYGGDNFQQQVIQPKEFDAETLSLIENVEKAVGRVTKAACTELKNFNKPSDDVIKVIVAVADFIEGPGHDWNTSRAKMFDFIKRGVGSKT